MYQLTILRKATYLHAIVTGQNSRETVVQYLGEILEACRVSDCDRVLIEERLEGARLRPMDVFGIVQEGSQRAFGELKAIAFVDVHAEGGLMRFAETVAVNRALPLNVFPTVADAERWLLDEET